MSKFKLGQSPWNKGLTKEKDERIASYGRKCSKIFKGKSNSERYGEETAKKDSNQRSIKMREHYRTLTDEEKVRWTEKWHCKKFVTGYFKSNKNNCNIYFASSYELKAYIKFEHDDSIKQFGRIHFTIPYIFSGRVRRYIPDVMVEYISGEKEIIEIKPFCQLNLLDVVEKKKALEQYCRENSMTYKFFTEKDLGVSKCA